MAIEQNNTRIAKNTLLLYFRMFITMGMYLYTSRIVINILGVADFGIYNVVGGVVVFFSFLNSSMASATQKFLVYEIGKSDNVKLGQVFSMSINIHLIIALLIFLIAETVGLWFLNFKLVIPVDRMIAANWVYQFSILSLLINIMWVPYNALIIAHEKMAVYAVVSLVDVSLKFISVIFLMWIDHDKLISYGAMVVLVSLIVFMIYKIYCNRQYSESKYNFTWNKDLFSQMLHFAGWNLFGNLAGVTMVQGVNILLNIFFGPTINAARAIAFQLSGAVNSFVGNFQTAINPQIHKSYASSDKIYMHSLIVGGAKYSFFLLYILVVPVLFKTEYILKLWLKVVPSYTVVFCQLLLIISLIDSLSGTLMTAAQATGKIKVYQSVVGGLILFNLPISYLFLTFGYPPESTFYVSLSISIVSFLVRLKIVSKLTGLLIMTYMRTVIFPISCVVLPTLVVMYYTSLLLGDSMLGLVTLVTTTCLIVFIFIFTLGLNNNERVFIQGKLRTSLKSIYK